MARKAWVRGYNLYRQYSLDTHVCESHLRYIFTNKGELSCLRNLILASESYTISFYHNYLVTTENCYWIFNNYQ